MKLSSAEVGDVLLIKGKKALVLDRCAEDRSSGSTTLHYFTKSDRRLGGEILWDIKDPQVTKIGTGRLKVAWRKSK